MSRRPLVPRRNGAPQVARALAKFREINPRHTGTTPVLEAATASIKVDPDAPAVYICSDGLVRWTGQRNAAGVIEWDPPLDQPGKPWRTP